MKKIFPLLISGFLLWLLPFLASFLFFTPQGELAVDVAFFKSIMFTLSTFLGSAFLVWYFRKPHPNAVRAGWIAGITWFVINILLDVIILIPFSGMSYLVYFTQVGWIYVNMIVMSVAFGMVVERTKKE